MSKGAVRRWFEITAVDGRKPTTYVEYFGGFGEWAYRSKIYRWEYVDKNANEFWFICSDLVADNHHVINDLKTRVKQQWQRVDLAASSNPINERQPAMKRKVKN